MKHLIESIKKSLKNENWYSALFISLAIPDICSSLENPPTSKIKYINWFNRYLSSTFSEFYGSDCYAFRCSYFHEGTNFTENQLAHDVFDKFHFTVGTRANQNKFIGCSFGGSRDDGKNIIQVDVIKFCNSMIDGCNKWLGDVLKDAIVQGRINNLLVINDNNIMGNGTVKFV